jgi:DNA-directed RNA polymerase specialized sigma24 family protein
VTRQRSLGEFGSGTERDLSDLFEAERAAWVAVRINEIGVREHARATDRSAGTVGNLLQRADEKLGRRSP